MIVALIPARYGSSRLNGKPLLKFGNVNMIQRVYNQTIKSKLIDKVYVVTDHLEIKESIDRISGNCILVEDDCLNGTERICIALNKYRDLFENAKLIVNVQGDEPYINPIHIDLAIEKMINRKNDEVKCSTLHFKIDNVEHLTDTSIGKLVLSKNNNILYCTRNTIPFNKYKKLDLESTNYYGHIGLFVFDPYYLINEYMIENTKLQLEEDIEWLKILEQDYKIVSSLVENYEIGVNNIEDYNYLIKKYNL